MVHEAHGTRKPVNKNRSGSGAIYNNRATKREINVFDFELYLSAKSALNMKYILCTLESREKEKF